MKLAMSASCVICERITQRAGEVLAQEAPAAVQLLPAAQQNSRFRNFDAAMENTKCDVKDSIMPLYASRAAASPTRFFWNMYSCG